MTNHIHFVAIAEREDSLAVLFGRANGRYAQAINTRKGRCGHLWQARFHSCVLSDSHLEIALRYVEDNPCRAGMVAAPADYRWSSAAAHLLGKPDRSRIQDRILALRKCTYSGRPLGDEPFRRGDGTTLPAQMAPERRERGTPSRENRLKSLRGCPKPQIPIVATQAVPLVPLLFLLVPSCSLLFFLFSPLVLFK